MTKVVRWFFILAGSFACILAVGLMLIISPDNDYKAPEHPFLEGGLAANCRSLDENYVVFIMHDKLKGIEAEFNRRYSKALTISSDPSQLLFRVKASGGFSYLSRLEARVGFRVDSSGINNSLYINDFPIRKYLIEIFRDRFFHHYGYSELFVVAERMVSDIRIDNSGICVEFRNKFQDVLARLVEGVLYLNVDKGLMSYYSGVIDGYEIDPNSNFDDLLNYLRVVLKARVSAGRDYRQELDAVFSVLARLSLSTQKEFRGVGLNVVKQNEDILSVFTLDGREDFAHHFTISSLLSLKLGSKVSRLIGLYREYRDAKESSGFSFKDLVADYSGVEFISLNIGCLENGLLGYLEDDKGESLSIMPSPSDFGEYIREDQLREEYGGFDGNRMRSSLDQIDGFVGQYYRSHGFCR